MSETNPKPPTGVIQQLDAVLTAAEQSAIKSFAAYYPSAVDAVQRAVEKTESLENAGEIIKKAHGKTDAMKKLVAISEDQLRLMAFTDCVDTHLQNK